ncbi:MAG: hypothetical protein GX671_01015, partial [Clostridiales bacterium]|nr:hypothetical protein [Clostridiales bacterium]
ITQYVGGYDYYEEKKASIESGKKYIEELKDEGGAANGAANGGLHTGAANDGLHTGNSAESSNDDLVDGLRDAQKASGMEVAAEGQAPLSPAEERALKKQKQAEHRRNERQRKELEDTIDSLETEVKEIQEDMCKPANLSDSKALRELQEKLDSAQEELDFVYDKWLNL